MNKDILFFENVYKTMIWGGNRMKSLFGYDIPADNTGECWAISAHPNGDCVCISGEYKGKKLSELWEECPELFGNYPSDRFPLLLKVIDAKTDLSIQVHPNDEYAGINENGSLGKTECWYILECEENSSLVIGHNAKTREELNSMIDNGEFRKLIREVPVKAGDFVQIDPGTVHAIKGGVVILETQQSSDITYRLYDYDRLQDGKKRPLHLKQSKDVITVPAAEGAVISTEEKEGIHKLVSCDYYEVVKINVTDRITIEEKVPFRIVSCIEGSGTVNGKEICKGCHFIVPGGMEKIVFAGNMTLVSSIPV